MNSKTDDLLETIDKAIHSEDELLDKQVPGAPFAVVALSYMVILALTLGAITLAVWLF